MAQTQSVKCKAQSQPTYHQILSDRIDHFVATIYRISKQFPKDEQYNLTSQIRRAALSIPLNYHEGHGRFLDGSRTQFLRISFGSLRECLYLIKFAGSQNYLSKDETAALDQEGKRVYAMFWGILRKS